MILRSKKFEEEGSVKTRGEFGEFVEVSHQFKCPSCGEWSSWVWDSSFGWLEWDHPKGAVPFWEGQREIILDRGCPYCGEHL